MEKIIWVIVLYTMMAALDYVNIFLIYDKFLLVERKQTKNIRFFWIVWMFVISYIYGLQYADVLYNKVIALSIYIPYYLKMLPVLWSYFLRRRKDILIILFYQLLIATLSQSIYTFIDSDVDKIFYELFVYHICQVFTAILITVFLLILLFFRKNNIVKIYFEELSSFQYIIFCIALFSSNSFGAVTILRYPDDILFKVLSLFNVVMVCVLIGQIILVRESDTRKGKIIDVLDEQMEKITDYYNEVIEQENQTKKFRHDIRNLLLVLYSLVEQGEDDKALEYLDKMSDICRQTTKKYDTGNFIADTLLSAKSTAAEEICTEITFDGYIPSDIIENVDLVILLSNILDNAIEACEKMTGKKQISVESILQKQMWIISVKNPVDKEVKIRKNRIMTTKSNKELHGYGLQNMEKVTQKYDGNLKLSCKEGFFTARAMVVLRKK